MEVVLPTRTSKVMRNKIAWDIKYSKHDNAIDLPEQAAIKRRLRNGMHINRADFSLHRGEYHRLFDGVIGKVCMTASIASVAAICTKQAPDNCVARLLFHHMHHTPFFFGLHFSALQVSPLLNVTCVAENQG